MLSYVHVSLQIRGRGDDVESRRCVIESPSRVDSSDWSRRERILRFEGRRGVCGVTNICDMGWGCRLSVCRMTVSAGTIVDRNSRHRV